MVLCWGHSSQRRFLKPWGGWGQAGEEMRPRLVKNLYNKNWQHMYSPLEINKQANKQAIHERMNNDKENCNENVEYILVAYVWKHTFVIFLRPSLRCYPWHSCSFLSYAAEHVGAASGSAPRPAPLPCLSLHWRAHQGPATLWACRHAGTLQGHHSESLCLLVDMFVGERIKCCLHCSVFLFTVMHLLNFVQEGISLISHLVCCPSFFSLYRTCCRVFMFLLIRWTQFLACINFFPLVSLLWSQWL